FDHSFPHRLCACLATLLLVTGAAPVHAVGTEDLPDIGAPWDTVMSQSEEAQVGRMVMHRLRDADQLLDDPELNAYIQAIGHRLDFCMVRDPTINAFALPGGYVGVNAGLLLATDNESELAGVLAHEVSHVTQRHMARAAQSQAQTALATTAGVIAAILLGA